MNLKSTTDKAALQAVVIKPVRSPELRLELGHAQKIRSEQQKAVLHLCFLKGSSATFVEDLFGCKNVELHRAACKRCNE